MLVVPGTVGRSECYDTSDFARSAETLREVADIFVQTGIKCAVEPINSAEVPFCSTVGSVLDYIKAVDHPGVQHVNGDIFHMHCGEPHVGEAILQCGERLLNLHVEDTNRLPLGTAMMDVDTVIRALYLLGYNSPGHFVTGEPLGPGRNSYAIMFGQHDKKILDGMVEQTVTVIREREKELLG
jgi:sugar phosphate isomerase/epimerase